MHSIYIVKKIKLLAGMLLLIIITNGCKKLVDVPAPTTNVTGESVYNSDATASSVLTGLYAQISNGSFVSGDFNVATASIWTSLSADELTLWSGVNSQSQVAYYKNTLSVNTAGSEFWINTYPLIFTCNSAIEGLSASTGLTPAVKQQLLGEAKFMRSLFYLYLVNLYGEVPIVVSTDYEVNRSLPRASKDLVYQQIISDLKEAEEMLSENYLKADVLTTTSDRVRPTKWAAAALLARAYLYSGDYANAEIQATRVISNNAKFNLADLNSVFLKNSNEAIWQLQPVNNGNNITNTQDGLIFILPATGPNTGFNPVYLNNKLVNSFEATDKRRVNWVGVYTDTVPNPDVNYYYPFKYKVNAKDAPVTEYLMILRLGETYLIRAEARAQQSKISEAKSDLDAIRARAGLDKTTANDKTSLLAAIMHERKVELFTESGHRWFDLKRTGSVDAVMSIETPLKGGSWKSNKQLYPVYSADILKNPNLSQNDGY